MRVVASFGSAKGTYFLRRSQESPPPALAAKAVALGRRRGGRLRCRRRPQPRPGWEGIPVPAAAAAVRLPARRRPAATAVPVVASLEARSLQRPHLAVLRGEGSRRRGGAGGSRPRRYPRRGAHRRRCYERRRQPSVRGPGPAAASDTDDAGGDRRSRAAGPAGPDVRADGRALGGRGSSSWSLRRTSRTAF